MAQSESASGAVVLDLVGDTSAHGGQFVDRYLELATINAIFIWPISVR
jgi:hypothetical protein